MICVILSPCCLGHIWPTVVGIRIKSRQQIIWVWTPGKEEIARRKAPVREYPIRKAQISTAQYSIWKAQVLEYPIRKAPVREYSKWKAQVREYYEKHMNGSTL